MLLERKPEQFYSKPKAPPDPRDLGGPCCGRTTADGNRTLPQGQQQRRPQARVTAVRVVWGSQRASWALVPRGSRPEDGAPVHPQSHEALSTDPPCAQGTSEQAAQAREQGAGQALWGPTARRPRSHGAQRSSPDWSQEGWQGATPRGAPTPHTHPALLPGSRAPPKGGQGPPC